MKQKFLCGGLLISNKKHFFIEYNTQNTRKIIYLGSGFSFRNRMNNSYCFLQQNKNKILMLWRQELRLTLFHNKGLTRKKETFNTMGRFFYSLFCGDLCRSYKDSTPVVSFDLSYGYSRVRYLQSISRLQKGTDLRPVRYVYIEHQ